MTAQPPPGAAAESGAPAPTPLRVLVIEDEEITASAHAEFLRRVGGFTVAGVAHDGRQALALLRDVGPVDLVLLDMNLPDVHGLDLCRTLRASGIEADVIAITAVRELAVVRASVALGVVLYLIKPFTYATFAERMRGYLEFRSTLGTGGTVTQHDVDAGFASLRATGVSPLAKGLSEETLESVRRMLRTADAAVSAGELSVALRVSRVTARRYLEYLVEQGSLERSPRYGTPGRPEFEYRRR